MEIAPYFEEIHFLNRSGGNNCVVAVSPMRLRLRRIVHSRGAERVPLLRNLDNSGFGNFHCAGREIMATNDCLDPSALISV